MLFHVIKLLLLICFAQSWIIAKGCNDDCFLELSSENLSVCTTQKVTECDENHSWLPNENFTELGPSLISIILLSNEQLQVLFKIGSLSELEDRNVDLFNIWVELLDNDFGNKSCLQYNLLNFAQNKEIFLRKTFIFHQCDDKIVAGHNYTVYVTYLPFGQQTVWSLTVPSQISSVLSPPIMETWQTIVSASVNFRKLELWVYVQPPPLYLNITILNLTLKRYLGIYTLTKDITFPFNVSNNPAMFKVFSENDYVVTVQVKGCNCTTSSSPKCNVNPPPKPTDTSTVLISSTSTMLISTESSKPTVPPSTGLSTYVIIILACVAIGTLTSVVIIVVCIVYHKCVKQNAPRMERFHDKNSNNLSFNMDEVNDGKMKPAVLLLYSFDCVQHEQVIVEFASYLKHVFHLTVFLDIWEQDEIRHQGINLWLNKRLETCQFCLVICSTGGRLRCRRKAAVTFRADRQVPDSFVLGIEKLHERIRTSRSAGVVLQPAIGVLLFEYSCNGDIPHQLDAMPIFYLMKDLCKLYSFLTGLPAEHAEQFIGITVHTYCKTDTGRQLYASLKLAKEYFEDHPDWLEAIIERSDVNNIDSRRSPVSSIGESSKLVVQRNLPVSNGSLPNSKTKMTNDEVQLKRPYSSISTEIPPPDEHDMKPNGYNRNGLVKGVTVNNGNNNLVFNKKQFNEVIPDGSYVSMALANGSRMRGQCDYLGNSEKEISLKEEVDFIVNFPIEKYTIKSNLLPFVADENLNDGVDLQFSDTISPSSRLL